MASVYGQTVGGLLADAGRNVLQFVTDNPLDSAAIATAPIPVAGDVVGLLADGYMFATEPESRTLTNLGLSVAGLAPAIPAASLARRVDIEGGLLSKTKYRKPIEEVENTFVPQEGALLPRQTVNPEQMQGGVLIPLVGDRTRAGGLLTKVDGVSLDTPVVMQGGMDYARSGAQAADNAAWASNRGVITGLQRQVDEMADRDTYLVYSAMGGRAGDASHHMADALVGQIKATGIPKATAKEFDADMKKLLPDFPGVGNDKLGDYLSNLSMEKRKLFIELAAQSKYVNKGFPDPMATRLAITDPELVEVASGMSGQMIAKGIPGASIIETPAYVHRSYPIAMQGEYMGGLLDAVPRQVMFPDFDAARRAAGKTEGTDHRAISMSKVFQEADQKWLDGVMGYLERKYDK